MYSTVVDLLEDGEKEEKSLRFPHFDCLIPAMCGMEKHQLKQIESQHSKKSSDKVAKAGGAQILFILMTYFIAGMLLFHHD